MKKLILSVFFIGSMYVSVGQGNCMDCYDMYLQDLVNIQHFYDQDVYYYDSVKADCLYQAQTPQEEEVCLNDYGTNIWTLDWLVEGSRQQASQDLSNCLDYNNCNN